MRSLKWGIRMPFKRRLDKTRDPQISLPMIKMFVEYRRCRCTCDPKVRFDECAGCRREKELESDLGIALQSKPWEFPCISPPSGPDGSAVDITEERWLMLQQAARELRRQEREARKAAAANGSKRPPSSTPAGSQPQSGA
jgi:hypothetical protein